MFTEKKMSQFYRNEIREGFFLNLSNELNYSNVLKNKFNLTEQLINKYFNNINFLGNNWLILCFKNKQLTNSDYLEKKEIHWNDVDNKNVIICVFELYGNKNLFCILGLIKEFKKEKIQCWNINFKGFMEYTKIKKYTVLDIREKWNEFLYLNKPNENLILCAPLVAAISSIKIKEWLIKNRGVSSFEVEEITNKLTKYTELPRIIYLLVEDTIRFLEELKYKNKSPKKAVICHNE